MLVDNRPFPLQPIDVDNLLQLINDQRVDNRADKYLVSVLPEANTLDSYNIIKPSFTACKNNILKSYREAVEVYHIDPRQLCLNK